MRIGAWAGRASASSCCHPRSLNPPAAALSLTCRAKSSSGPLSPRPALGRSPVHAACLRPTPRPRPRRQAETFYDTRLIKTFKRFHPSRNQLRVFNRSSCPYLCTVPRAPGRDLLRLPLDLQRDPVAGPARALARRLRPAVRPYRASSPAWNVGPVAHRAGLR